MNPINRRKFLLLSGSSTAAVLLSQCSNRRQDQNQLQASLASVQTSQDGLLEVNLTASSHQLNLGGRQASLFAYNNQVPGPRWEAKPGDTLRIRFTNNLDQSTNLHYHGLHISPEGSADNVFLDISPGETFNYEFTLPANHPGGTFWYHPHLHGLVAQQVFAGLAGLIVVRGELDEIPEIQQATEEFLVFQDFALTRRGERSSPNHMERMTGREGEVITVNGQVQPSFNVGKNGLLRLRLLNGSPSRFYNLALEDHPFYLIANDSGSLAAPVELSQLLLTPGQRAEVLVRGEREPGEYRLLNLPYNRGSMGMMGGGGMMGRGRMRNRSNQDERQVLAKINYTEATTTVPLPQELIAPEPLPESQIGRRFDLNHGMAPGQGMVFLINGKAFAPDRIDVQSKLNTVEEWEIANTGVMDHPFHVHTNHFQVVARNNQPVPYLSWQDTVNVAPGETIRLRLRFQDFPGKTVYHCHILDHEDLGMMGMLEISS